MIESYPLQWKDGVPRTKKPRRSRFHTPQGVAVDNLLNELRLMEARNIIITSNVKTYRRMGINIPYAHQKVEDTGVSVYFEYNNVQHCIPCDRWDRIHDNIHAIGKTIEAMRGIERWGTHTMMKATFKGFEALPPSTGEVYGVKQNKADYFKYCSNLDELREHYREMAKIFHKDKGGDDNTMSEINKQYKQKRKELQQ